SPGPEELVSYEEAAVAIGSLEASARCVGIALKLAPDSGPPPCVFPNPNRVAHLYSLTPGAALRADHRQLSVCDECQMHDRCSGLSVAPAAGERRGRAIGHHRGGPGGRTGDAFGR